MKNLNGEKTSDSTVDKRTDEFRRQTQLRNVELVVADSCGRSKAIPISVNIIQSKTLEGFFGGEDGGVRGGNG